MEKHYNQLREGAPIFNDDDTVYGFDNELKFDVSKKRYILKSDSVINELGVDLTEIKRTKENVNFFLDELSNLVYAYIYKKKAAHKRKKLEYLLAFDMDYREAIYESMLDTIRYALYSGGNIVGYQPAVNFNESGKLDIEEVRNERIISYVTDSALKTRHLVDRDFRDKFKIPEYFEWR